MGNKTVMVLVIPEPKVRKATAKAVRPHRDKTKYSRKAKRKAPEWGLFFVRRPGNVCLEKERGAWWIPSLLCRIFSAVFSSGIASATAIGRPQRAGSEDGQRI